MSTRVSELLYCPQMISAPSDLEIVRDETDQWLASFGLLTDERVRRRYEAIDAPGLANFACPDSNLEQKIFIGKWSAWLFLLDDICDEDGLGSMPERSEAYFKRLIESYTFPFDGRDPSPMGRSLRSLAQDVSAFGDPEHFERFGKILWGYFSALMWEDANRLSSLPPTLAEYTLKRREAGAIFLMFGLIEISSGVRLPFERLDHGPLKEAREHAASAIGWANDILSVRREAAANDLHNVVLVLEHERGLTRPRAFREAIELHNERMRAFRKIEAEIAATGDVQGSSYMKALSNWVKGGYDWALTTLRYEDFAIPEE